MNLLLLTPIFTGACQPSINLFDSVIQLFSYQDCFGDGSKTVYKYLHETGLVTCQKILTMTGVVVYSIQHALLPITFLFLLQTWTLEKNWLLVLAKRGIHPVWNHFLCKLLKEMCKNIPGYLSLTNANSL